MRERSAILICWVTALMVVGLSWLFAFRHNQVSAAPAPAVAIPQPQPPPAPVAAPPSAVVEAIAPVEPVGPVAAAATAESAPGPRLFREHGCTACHALGGAGNPRNPLDGVGARLNREELWAWTTGTGVAASQLAPAVVRRKTRYQKINDSEKNALLDYLAAARTEAR